MLFSAGTFLYVATVHVLPELMHQQPAHGHGWHQLPTTTDQTSLQPPQKPSHGSSKLKAPEILILVVGALIPLLLTAGHHH